MQRKEENDGFVLSIALRAYEKIPTEINGEEEVNEKSIHSTSCSVKVLSCRPASFFFCWKLMAIDQEGERQRFFSVWLIHPTHCLWDPPRVGHECPTDWMMWIRRLGDYRSQQRQKCAGRPRGDLDGISDVIVAMRQPSVLSDAEVIWIDAGNVKFSSENSEPK